MKTSEIATGLPQKGDVIEVVVRGRVSAVQVECGGEPIVYFERDGVEYDGYAPPVYLNNHVQALTVITAKPRLDLNALPVGTLIETTFEGDRQRIFRKVDDGWLGLNGATYSSAVLMADSTEMYELVRKEATP